MRGCAGQVSQECRVIGIDGRRLDRVAESNVYLHGDAGTGESSAQFHPQALVFGIVADRLGGHSGRVKGQAVVRHGNAAYVTQRGNDVVRFGASVAGKSRSLVGL